MNAGFVRMKPQSSSQPDVIAFSHPDPSFAGRLLISLDPGFPRQLDFGFRDWLRGELAEPFKFESPREFIPVIRQLAYDHLWHGAGVNNPVCWDVITEANLEETGRLMVGVLGRLASLAARINGLGAS